MALWLKFSIEAYVVKISLTNVKWDQEQNWSSSRNREERESYRRVENAMFANIFPFEFPLAKL